MQGYGLAQLAQVIADGAAPSCDGNLLGEAHKDNDDDSSEPSDT